MPKKRNPRNVPATQADVERAWGDGADFGMEFCLNLILLVLKDKHNAPNEDILQLRDEFMDAVDSLNRGYMSYADVKRTLHGDYDFRVHLARKGG